VLPLAGPVGFAVATGFVSKSAANNGSGDLPRRYEIEEALRRLAPLMPAHEFGTVCDHAMDSPGLRTASPEAAAWLSLVAYARHVFTDYDDLLGQGYDQVSARHFVVDDLQAALDGWGIRRRLGDDD
jgi:hypothetical protein